MAPGHISHAARLTMDPPDARRVHDTLITLMATALAMILAVGAQRPDAPARPRVVITADPELDDTDTLIRALR